jgi:hypothetical protein
MTHSADFLNRPNLFRDNTKKSLFPDNPNSKFKSTGPSLTTPKIKEEIKTEQLEKMLKKSLSRSGNKNQVSQLATAVALPGVPPS